MEPPSCQMFWQLICLWIYGVTFLVRFPRWIAIERRKKNSHTTLFTVNWQYFANNLGILFIMDNLPAPPKGKNSMDCVCASEILNWTFLTFLILNFSSFSFTRYEQIMDCEILSINWPNLWHAMDRNLKQLQKQNNNQIHDLVFCLAVNFINTINGECHRNKPVSRKHWASIIIFSLCWNC